MLLAHGATRREACARRRAAGGAHRHDPDPELDGRGRRDLDSRDDDRSDPRGAGSRPRRRATRSSSSSASPPAWRWGRWAWSSSPAASSSTTGIGCAPSGSAGSGAPDRHAPGWFNGGSPVGAAPDGHDPRAEAPHRPGPGPRAGRPGDQGHALPRHRDRHRRRRATSRSAATGSSGAGERYAGAVEIDGRGKVVSPGFHRHARPRREHARAPGGVRSLRPAARHDDGDLRPARDRQRARARGPAVLPRLRAAPRDGPARAALELRAGDPPRDVGRAPDGGRPARPCGTTRR